MPKLKKQERISGAARFRPLTQDELGVAEDADRRMKRPTSTGQASRVCFLEQDNFTICLLQQDPSKSVVRVGVSKRSTIKGKRLSIILWEDLAGIGLAKEMQNKEGSTVERRLIPSKLKGKAVRIGGIWGVVRDYTNREVRVQVLNMTTLEEIPSPSGSPLVFTLDRIEYVGKIEEYHLDQPNPERGRNIALARAVKNRSVYLG